MRCEAGHDLTVCGRRGRIPCEYHQVHRGQSGRLPPKALTDQPAKPVASDGKANLLLGDREAESRVIQRVRLKEDREMAIRGTLAVLEHIIKIRRVQQAQLRREGLPGVVSGRTRRRCDRGLPLIDWVADWAGRGSLRR